MNLTVLRTLNDCVEQLKNLSAAMYCIRLRLPWR